MNITRSVHAQLENILISTLLPKKRDALALRPLRLMQKKEFVLKS
jgi:hypothetical protein